MNTRPPETHGDAVRNLLARLETMLPLCWPANREEEPDGDVLLLHGITALDDDTDVQCAVIDLLAAQVPDRKCPCHWASENLPLTEQLDLLSAARAAYDIACDELAQAA